MHAIICIFGFILVSQEVYGAKILMISAHNMASHTKSMYPFGEMLVDNNHEVYMLQLLEGDHEKAKGKKVKDIVLMLPPTSGAHGVDPAMLWTPAPTRPENVIFPWYGTTSVCKKILHNQKLHDEFMKVVKDEWDLLVVDSMFTACGILAAHINGAPWIDFSTSFVMQNVLNALGAQWKGAFMPSFRPPGKFEATDFFDRFWNAYDIHVVYGLYSSLEYLLPRWIDHPLTANLSLYEFYTNSALGYGSMPHELDYPHGKSMNILEMDGDCPKTGTLPENYLSFVEDPTSKGTILFAMGHFADFEHAPPTALKAIVDAFNELHEYRIIWQYVSKGPKPNVGKHVMLDAWIPQAGILSHNKTVLFISHMGFKSFREAICSKVPVVALPMFAEQSRNAAIARKRGIGEYVDKTRITKESFLTPLKQVLNDPNYKKNMGKVYEFLNDRITDSIKLGGFWLDFFLKHQNYALAYLRQKVPSSNLCEYSSILGISGFLFVFTWTIF